MPSPWNQAASNSGSGFFIATLLGYCVTKTPFYFLDLFGTTDFGIIRPVAGYVLIGIAWIIRPPRLSLPIGATLGVLSCLSLVPKLANPVRYPGYILFIPNYSDSVLFGLMIVSLSTDEFRRLFRLYRNLILALLVPAVIIMLGIAVNLPMPYSYVSLGGRDAAYRVYMGMSVFTDSTMTMLGPFVLARLCGPFEEPGMLGTLIAYLLVADYILDSKWNWVKWSLILGGLSSQSLAFNILLAALVVAHLLRRRMLRTFAGIAAVLSVGAAGYLMLPNGARDVVYSNYIYRMQYDFSARQFRDRSRAGFEQRFVDYCATASPMQLLIGNGWSANRSDPNAQYSTAHSIVYDAGFLGLILVGSFVGYYYIYRACLVGGLPFVILGAACIASFYQRPDVMAVHSWMVICSFLAAGNAGGNSHSLTRKQDPFLIR